MHDPLVLLLLLPVITIPVLFLRELLFPDEPWKFDKTEKTNRSFHIFAYYVISIVLLLCFVAWVLVFEGHEDFRSTAIALLFASPFIILVTDGTYVLHEKLIRRITKGKVSVWIRLLIAPVSAVIITESIVVCIFYCYAYISNMQ